jgi:hypothetical protein
VVVQRHRRGADPGGDRAHAQRLEAVGGHRLGRLEDQVRGEGAARATGLAARFDYPDILRRPTSEVLRRFRDGGTSLVLLWWGLALSAVALAPLAVLVARVLADADGSVVTLGLVAGVVASVVQFLGLVRWPFVVPYLAREATAPDVPPARLEAVDVVFEALNRYLGVAVGEHLGYLFTGGWSVLAGVAMVQSSATPAWLGVAGIVVGAALAVCSLEFVGPFEPAGWRFAGALTPVAYVVWSVWLAATGVVLML